MRMRAAAIFRDWLYVLTWRSQVVARWLCLSAGGGLVLVAAFSGGEVHEICDLLTLLAIC